MSEPPSDPLDLLGKRIELLATSPGEIRLRWTRLAGPVLRFVGWQPVFKVDAASSLIDALRKTKPKPPRKRAARPASLVVEDLQMRKLLDVAIEELDENVTSAERACVVRGRVPTSRAAWLRRLYEVVARA